MKILTIGAYGYDESSFFQALKDAGVDVFCDIRQRRGMRGSEYAFANCSRLQKRLGELGIPYVHVTELAPSTEMREIQRRYLKAEVKDRQIANGLSREFVEAYATQRLDCFNLDGFMRQVGRSQTACLFCVERRPEACHRSLAAEYLATRLGCEVQHLVPAST